MCIRDRDPEIPTAPNPKDQGETETPLNDTGTEPTTTENKDAPDIEIPPPEMDFDTAANTPIYAQSRKAKHKVENPERLRKYLGFISLKAVKETLRKTTQLAKAILSYPLVRHRKSRFPWLNNNRIDEKVSTDTIFANCKALGGDTCAQIFYGMTSQCIDVYGMKTESEFPAVYQDFIRNCGIPSVLRRDWGLAQPVSYTHLTLPTIYSV